MLRANVVSGSVSEYALLAERRGTTTLALRIALPASRQVQAAPQADETDGEADDHAEQWEHGAVRAGLRCGDDHGCADQCGHGVQAAAEDSGDLVGGTDADLAPVIHPTLETGVEAMVAATLDALRGTT
jgi:hypothetical protein